MDQMMARLQVDEEKRTATATQHASELASANQAKATMESQMKTILSQVQALHLANNPNHGNNYDGSRGRRRGAGRGCGGAQPSDPPTLKY